MLFKTGIHYLTVFEYLPTGITHLSDRSLIVEHLGKYTYRDLDEKVDATLSFVISLAQRVETGGNC